LLCTILLVSTLSQLLFNNDLEIIPGSVAQRVILQKGAPTKQDCMINRTGDAVVITIIIIIITVVWVSLNTSQTSTLASSSD